MISRLVGMSSYLLLAGGIEMRLLAASPDASNFVSPYATHLSANSSIESVDGAFELKRLDLPQPAIRCTALHQAFESVLASVSTTASICLVTWSLQSLRACLLSSGLKWFLNFLTPARVLHPCTWLLLNRVISSAP